MELSHTKTLELLKAYPDLKGIVGFGSLGPIGAAQALKEKNLCGKVKIVGHKGGGSSVPENSRAALKHALSLGLDAVEIDIWPTADRRFVLFHDADIARLTGHAGWTMHLTSDELRTLEIGSRVSTEYAGERILLLEEALDLLAGKADLFLEVKFVQQFLVPVPDGHFGDAGDVRHFSLRPLLAVDEGGDVQRC